MLQQHRALASIGFRVNPTISKLHLVQYSPDDDLYGTFAQFCVGYSTTTSFRFATICRHFGIVNELLLLLCVFC